MTNISEQACTCGSGKPFHECCGDVDAPFWNERANGRIPGTFFDPEFVKYVENEPLCEYRGAACPPGILVRQLSSNYRLQDLAQALISTREASETVVRDSGQQKRKTAARVTGMVEQGALDSRVIELVRRAYACEVEPFFNCKLKSFESPHVLRYSRGSHYKPHSDSDILNTETRRWEKAQDRDYSLLIYLDEDFEGGELVFPNFDYKLRPQAGMLAAFPSDSRYLHGAMPVLSGVRHAIVSWCAV